MKKHEHSLQDQLYELRLLVLQENENGTFSQILLGPTQFRNISNEIVVSKKKDPTLREGFDLCAVNIDDTNELSPEPFLGMESIFFDDDEETIPKEEEENNGNN